MNRLLLILLFCLTMCTPWALFSEAARGISAPESDDSQSVDTPPERWSAAEFKKLKALLDFQSEALNRDGMTLQDIRISPMIKDELWYEIPIETGFLTAEDQIVSFLKKNESFSFANAALAHRAIIVSQTAEVLPNRKQLLSITLNQTCVVGRSSERVRIAESQKRLANGMAEVLKLTTFEPQIRRGGGEISKGVSHWITNFRIDSDLRVQLTGYGLSFAAVGKLAEDLFQNPAFAEVFLSNVNRGVFEKQAVWRFDIAGKLR